MPDEIVFAWDDAWVLTAFTVIRRHPEGHGIKSIISAADYINHAIIKYEELNNGLGRLIDAGYVISNGGLFKLATELEEALLKTGRRPPVKKIWDAFDKLLGVSLGSSPESQATQVLKPVFSREEYQAALEAYLIAFWK